MIKGDAPPKPEAEKLSMNDVMKHQVEIVARVLSISDLRDPDMNIMGVPYWQKYIWPSTLIVGALNNGELPRIVRTEKKE